MMLKELKRIVDLAVKELGEKHEVIITVGCHPHRKNYVVPEDDNGVPLTHIGMFVDALDRYHLPIVEAEPHPQEHEPLKPCPDCLRTYFTRDPNLPCQTCKGRGVI